MPLKRSSGVRFHEENIDEYHHSNASGAHVKQTHDSAAQEQSNPPAAQQQSNPSTLQQSLHPSLPQQQSCPPLQQPAYHIAFQQQQSLYPPVQQQQQYIPAANAYFHPHPVIPAQAPGFHSFYYPPIPHQPQGHYVNHPSQPFLHYGAGYNHGYELDIKSRRGRKAANTAESVRRTMETTQKILQRDATHRELLAIMKEPQLTQNVNDDADDP
jgi:hypothetical protein